MTLDQFKDSLSAETPPGNIPVYLRALWYDAKGDWEKAHTIIQDMEDKAASWIHAYLHRKEGDTGNADYWYRRAGKHRPGMTLPEEWESIASSFIHR